MDTIASNLTVVRDRIAEAALRSHRNPDDVNLLAVSKTKPASAVREAISAGQHHFGENYLQDALDKVPLFPDATWHFIGRLQSNKTRLISNNFDWVHSLCSFKVARRLSEQRDRHTPLNVLLQVNISEDPAKDGLTGLNECWSLLDQIGNLSSLRPRGLMTILDQSDDAARQRSNFHRLGELLLTLQSRSGISEFDQLSMGMTGDLEAAIAEGATWVRIGTAIFGTRQMAQDRTREEK